MEGPTTAQVDPQERETALAGWTYLAFAAFYLALLGCVAFRLHPVDIVAGAAGLLAGGFLGGRRWARAPMLLLSLVLIWCGVDLIYLEPGTGLSNAVLLELFWPAASFWLGFFTLRRVHDFRRAAGV